MSENNQIVFKHTSLETTTDVSSCLDWKMESIRADKLPVDTGLADYISFGVDNLEAQLSQLKALKAQATKREKEIKSQIEYIKIDGASFLLENGLERLDGLICSSVTVSKEKQASVTTIEEREFVMNISQAELEELLIGLGKAEIKTVTKEKTTNSIPAKLKINKRKIAHAEIVDG